MAHVGKCRRCGKSFKGRRDKIYCSDRCRYIDWREKPEEAQACFYCGMPADTIDHVPPQTVRPRLVELGIASRYPFKEVDSCRECNCWLGSRKLWTLDERKRFVKKVIRRRYAKYLRIPEWSDRELGHLGPRMQETVMMGEVLRDLTRQRLRW